MRILSAAHDIKTPFNNIPFKRATSVVPEQCSNFCRNAQLECQQNPLTPALCGTGSNFLDQYNSCQSCINDNSRNPELIKASLAMRFMKCVGYCKLQAAGAPPSSGSPTAAGQDEDLFTTATAIPTEKTSSASPSPAVQTMVSTSASASMDKGERTMITSTTPGTTARTSPPTNNPPSPITSTSTPQLLSTLPSSSSSFSLAYSTSTSLTTTLNSTQTQGQATSTPPLTSSPTDTSPTSTSQPSAATTSSARTAPWVWAIVGITITVVLLLSGGSFFFFYKRGGSKRGRGRARQRGMKGMVELKETATKGFVDHGRGSRSGSRTQGIGRVAELDTVRDAYEIGTQRDPRDGGGGARSIGNVDGTLHVPPVELSSVSGFVELPTSFNERGEGMSNQGRERTR